MTNTKQQIMEEAFLLFLKHGFKTVRISDIEKAAQITRGTFYYHFLGKEEVLKEGIHAYYELLNSHSLEEFKRISTLREYIDLTIWKVLSVDHYTPVVFNAKIPEILCLSLMAEVMALFPDLKKVIMEAKMLRLSKLEQLIYYAQSAGELRSDLDISILAKNLLNISAGIINYIMIHQNVTTALAAVRDQYEQLYSLAAAR
jgi:AcrR family transcriptional regulator